MSKKIALITGATAGIGMATAEQLAQQNFDLIVTGRRKERLEVLANHLQDTYEIKVKTLCFDVQDKMACQDVMIGISADKYWRNISVLINNAGLAAGRDPIQTASFEDWDAMIDTNIKGLVYMSRLVAPLMITQKKGHIINVGSLAGKESYGNGSVYCGSKHAVDAITKAMRIDLIETGIKVASVCPGLVETEFSIVRFKGDEAQANAVYRGFEALLASDIADAIWYMISRPEHVNIADMLVLPKAQANSSVVFRKN